MNSNNWDFKSLPSEEQLARAQWFRDGSMRDLEMIERRYVSEVDSENLSKFEPPVSTTASDERFAAVMRAWGR
jgi:hypothetical protein